MGGNGQGRRSRDVLGEISSELPIPSAIRQRRPMVSVLGSAPSGLDKQEWPLFKSLVARLGQSGFPARNSAESYRQKSLNRSGANSV